MGREVWMAGEKERGRDEEWNDGSRGRREEEGMRNGGKDGVKEGKRKG